MAYHPFTSQYTNVFNEAAFNTTPSVYGLNNNSTTESHSRNIVDTFSHTIAANPQPQMHSCCPCTPKYSSPNAQIIHPQKQFIPGGVSFTFNPQPPIPNNIFQNFSLPSPSMTVQTSPQQLYQPNLVPPPSVSLQRAPEQLFNLNQIRNPQQLFQPLPQMPHQQPLSLQQQIALKQLETQGLELMLLQDHLKKNPYKLQFHYNGQTSTTDLLQGSSQVPLSKGLPDFNTLSGVVANLRNEAIGTDQPYCNCYESCLNSSTNNGKKLMLTTSPDLKSKEETRESKLYGNLTEETSTKDVQTKQPKDISNEEVKTKKPHPRKGKRPSKKSKPRKKCLHSEALLDSTCDDDDDDDDDVSVSMEDYECDDCDSKKDAEK